jgi:hypothetical protein
LVLLLDLFFELLLFLFPFLPLLLLLEPVIFIQIKRVRNQEWIFWFFWFLFFRDRWCWFFYFFLYGLGLIINFFERIYLIFLLIRWFVEGCGGSILLLGVEVIVGIDDYVFLLVAEDWIDSFLADHLYFSFESL